MSKEYEVGKWYKGFKEDSNKTAAKFLKLSNDKKYFYFSERIYKDDNRPDHIVYHGNWYNELDLVECPLEEISQYLPEGHPDKVFVLPERWCVRWECRENYQIINKYFNTIGKTYHYESDRIHRNAIVCSDGTYINKINSSVKAINPPNEYTLLTFEQFKRYVLNEKPDKVYSEDMDYLIDTFKKLNIC